MQAPTIRSSIAPGEGGQGGSAQTPAAGRRWLDLANPHTALIAFFGLTFAYSWLLGLPLLVGALSLFPVHLSRFAALAVQLLAAWGPTFTALALTAVAGGRVELRALLARLVRWRVDPRWYAFVLLAPLVVVGAALGSNWLLGGGIPKGVVLAPWYAPLLQLVIAFPLYLLLGGPLGEELGWRGYALPRLLLSRGPFSAGLLVGAIWALWHLPLLWIPDTGSGYGLLQFGWFFGQLTGWGVLLGWVYARTRGNLLLCVLLHASINTTFSQALPVAPLYTGQWQPALLADALIWALAIGITLASPIRRPARAEAN